jgi:hypothetical protein
MMISFAGLSEAAVQIAEIIADCVFRIVTVQKEG